jgi:hypothetical protein
MGEEAEQALPSRQPPDRVLDYQSAGATRFVLLRRMRAMEAQLARTKLEAEGIRCFIDDQLINQADPLLFADVELQVAEEDALMAAWILDHRPGDVRPDEYVEEEWRCPACHKRSVDLLPLTGFWTFLKYLFVLMILTPFMLWATGQVIPIPRIIAEMGTMWIFATAFVGGAILLATRHKRCRECGHEWTAKN